MKQEASAGLMLLLLFRLALTAPQTSYRNYLIALLRSVSLKIQFNEMLVFLLYDHARK